MKTNGNLWSPVENNGIPWKSLEIHKNLSKSMESNGNRWKSGGNAWNPVEIHGVR